MRKKSNYIEGVPNWRQHNGVDKRNWYETGLQIIITLGNQSREDSESNSWDHTNTNNLIPGSIHTIVDRPSRKSRRNGTFGVWVEGVHGKVFTWFHEWWPYTPLVTMTRKAPVLQRTVKPTGMERLNKPELRRTK